MDRVTEKTGKEKARFSYERFFRVTGPLLIMIMGLLLVSCKRMEVQEGSADYAFYMQGGEIHYVDLSNIDSIEPKRLTNKWYKFVDDGGVYDIYPEVAFVKKNHALVFPDELSSESMSMRLFYKELQKEDRFLIAEDVKDYQVTKDSDRVTYMLWGSHDLYQWDIETKKSERIGEAVGDYKLSKNGDKLLFIDEAGGCYIKEKGKDKQLIAEDVFYLGYVDDDLNEMVLSKEDGLYRYIDGSEEKIADDAYELHFLNSREGYYLTDRELIPWASLTIDDLPESEAKRELLSSMEEEAENALLKYSLWYMKDGESKKLSDDYLSWARAEHPSAFLSGYRVPGKAELFFRELDEKRFQKIRLSELSDVYDLIEQIYGQDEKVASYKLAIGEHVLDLPDIPIDEVSVSPSGTRFCYFADLDEEYIAGDLYQIEVKDLVVSKPQLIDEGVSFYQARILDEDLTVYFKHKGEFVGDLYINGEQIDQGADVTRLNYNKGTKEFLYFVDRDRHKDQGTLKLFADGESKLIANDVHEAHFLPSGKIVYLTERDQAKGTTKLNVYSGQKSVRVAQEVDFLIFPMGQGPRYEEDH
ncbi:MAG: hypothetical protein Q4A75_03180 [Peptostreptococcaceae bacterium]|nr:hypothetical protein [Peptostreptococcaceae bacterium]